MARIVLVADDSPTIQKKALGILKGEGFEVETVSNGVAAVKRLAFIRPVVILADVSMPGRDGYEVCEYVKNSADHSRVPVLLIASDMEPYDEARGAQVRADGKVIKPFEPHDLIMVVERFAAQFEASAQPDMGATKVMTAPMVAPPAPEFHLADEEELPTVIQRPAPDFSASEGLAFSDSPAEVEASPDYSRPIHPALEDVPIGTPPVEAVPGPARESTQQFASFELETAPAAHDSGVVFEEPAVSAHDAGVVFEEPAAPSTHDSGVVFEESAPPAAPPDFASFEAPAAPPAHEDFSNFEMPAAPAAPDEFSSFEMPAAPPAHQDFASFEAPAAPPAHEDFASFEAPPAPAAETPMILDEPQAAVPEPVFIEEQVAPPAEPPDTPAAIRTMIFRTPIELADPVWKDETLPAPPEPEPAAALAPEPLLAPEPEVIPEQEVVPEPEIIPQPEPRAASSEITAEFPAAPEPEPEPVSSHMAATSLDSFSLDDATAGQVHFVTQEAEATLMEEAAHFETVHSGIAPPVEAPTESAAEPAAEVAPAEVTPAQVAPAEAETPAEAPPPAPQLDLNLIFEIVHRVVVRMSPPALPKEATEEMARRLADEISAELAPPSPPAPE